jgi:hypothetical protein
MGIDLSADCTIGGSAGHGFTIKGGSTYNMIDATDDSGDIEVSYCDINSVGSAERGVRVARGPGYRIQHNSFFTDTGDSAVYLGGGVGGYIEDVDISNNMCDAPANSLFVDFSSTDGNAITITNNVTDVGIEVGVGNTDTNVVNLTISGNTFNSGSGIELYEATASTGVRRLEDVNITGNTFAAGSNAYALLIDVSLEPNDVNWATLTFTNNLVLRTPGGPTYTVDNQIGGGVGVPAVLKAEHNYWGSATGPTNGCPDGIGASISDADYVDFEPFWTDAAMTTEVDCP